MATHATATNCLILCTTDEIGGTERAVCSLTQGLTDQQWHVRTIFPRTDRSKRLLDWCHDQRVQAEDHPAVLRVIDHHTFDHVRRLRRLVQAIRPDVVNVHYGGGFMSLTDLVALRLAGRQRCVVTVNHPAQWSGAHRRKRLMTAAAARLADAVVVISGATRSGLLAAGVPTSKIHLIPTGLRPPDRKPTRAAARANLGLPADAFVIASLARLVPHKGLHDLVEATARIDDPTSQIRLAIGGDGPERSRLESLAHARLGDRGRILGRVPDTADLYAAADIFALPSYEEGFGMVYIEAAFHGVPGVGAAVGGVTDAIDDGRTGLLVPPGDVAALSATLQRLWAQPGLRRHLGVAARDRAYAEYTEQTMASRYLPLLRGHDRDASGQDGLPWTVSAPPRGPKLAPAGASMVGAHIDRQADV